MKQKIRCDFCGDELVDPESGKELDFVEGKKQVSGGTETVIICEECVSVSHKMIFDEEKAAEDTGTQKSLNKTKREPAKRKISKGKIGEIPSPTKIYSHLRTTVLGQENYIKQLSLFGYEHMKRLKWLGESGVAYSDVPAKKNVFVLGPTGTGKTLGVTTLADYLDVPCAVFDVSSLTADGYVGQDISDVANSLIAASGGDLKRAATGIVALDEVDKIATKDRTSIDVGGECVQMALLKLIESTKYTDIPLQNHKYKKSRSLDTSFNPSNVSFIAMGVFSGLKGLINIENNRIGFNRNHNEVDKEEIAYSIADDEDIDSALVNYGMLPEFLGRFTGGRSILKPLGVEDLKNIILSDSGAIKREIKNFALEGIHLEITDKAATVLAKRAFEQKRGARSLSFQFNQLVLHLKFEHFCNESGINHIKIGTDKSGEIKITESRK
ncbi:MAG: AAA family ATPase [bacterium]